MPLMNATKNHKKQSLSSTLYTEEYFLTACEGYDEFIASEGQHLSRRLQDAFEVAQVEAGMKVLDAGCGRGEIIRHCMGLGVVCYGFDYAEVACRMTRDMIEREGKVLVNEENAGNHHPPKAGVVLADAKKLPYPNSYFDRVLMFDVVEHLYPWELQQSLLEIRRVLKSDGLFVVHTAPNRWYDAYAYPMVRLVRTMMGQGTKYPKDPRAITPANQDVHVNEQDILSMRRTLRSAGFDGKIWLDSPPQNRQENVVMAGLRRLAFDVPPFRWFFERELFAVASKI